MAPFGKIYSYPGSWRVERAQVAAAFNGLEVVYAENFTMQEDNKTPEFLAKFPLGKVPAFESATGFCVAESSAIARYVAGSGPLASQLLGTDPETRAKIDEWSFFTEGELTNHTNPVAYMTHYKFMPLDQAVVDRSTANFQRALAVVEAQLQGGKKTLVGDKITFADITVALALVFSLGAVFGEDILKTAPSTVAWLKELSEMPEFKAVSNWGKLKA
ncbi:glutathione S-transferase [Microdochium trichocladiopsis]|uniref:Glutathione S-transferase n=1 Tax=Microdochium trichocladiopsis TaxID=1682393 RepID=A0A9P8XRE8_9PEZI|nr:glutathione S-transferase [Microdochium trichocladiopsis]KAH7014090.1 glutathione S-transferase [Microdochium trichocladiopsis]